MCPPTRRPRLPAGRDRRGAAAVELAVLLPFMMLLFVIAVDWARLMYYSITVTECARSGALYACDPVFAAQSRYKSVSEAATAEAPNLPTAPTVTSASGTDTSGNPWVQVTVSLPFRTLTNYPGVPSSQTLTRTVEMRVLPLTTR